MGNCSAKLTPEFLQSHQAWLNSEAFDGFGWPPPPKSRKRLYTDGESISDSSSSESSTMSDDAADDDGYTLVESRRTWRARKKVSSPSTAKVITTTSVTRLTVVYVPTCPRDCVRNISRHHLSTFLKALAPGNIKKARVNPRKNVIAVGASNPAVVSSLLATTLLCGVAMRSYIPRGKNTIVGVIEDVDADITDAELRSLII